MPNGRVSFYIEGRGFGFIIPDDGGADVFVHANHLLNADVLTKDQRVSFEIVNDDRRGKPRADRVRVIDGTARNAGGFDPVTYDNNFLLSPLHD
jgi:CspA family cold shock protein